MNKNNKKLIGVMTFVICLSLLNVFLTLNLDKSYAADPVVDESGYPTTTFTSSTLTSTPVNYIRDSGVSDPAGYLDNFDVYLAKRASDSNGTPLYSLMKNAEMPGSSETFDLSVDGGKNITDKGLLYILAHGYNTTNTNNNIFAGQVSDNNIKQYVTQVAIWLYVYANIDSFSGDGNFCNPREQCTFTNSNGATVSVNEIINFITSAKNVSGYSYLDYILQLFDAGNSHKNQDVQTSHIDVSGPSGYNFGNDGYMTTELITPVADRNQENFVRFEFRINDPNNIGATLIEEGNSFRIRVPLANVAGKDLRTVTATITAHFIKEAGRAYHVTNTTQAPVAGDNNLLRPFNGNKIQRFADVLFGYVPTETVTESIPLQNIVKISKVDITNDEELENAHLTITKDSTTGQEVQSWTSTGSPHYIYLPTPTGGQPDVYYLCETIPPNGYQTAECVRFTYDGTKVESVMMKDAPLVPVPDTAAFSKKLIMIIGVLLVAVGLGGLGVVYFKKYQNKSSI